MFNRLDRIPACDRQTDGQTSCDGIVRAIHMRPAVKMTECEYRVSGYGHSTPQTPGGKVFCMFYALAGIPLNLVMFQSIGERLNVMTTFLLTRLLRALRRCLRRSVERRRTVDDVYVSPTHLIIVSLSVSSLVVSGGAWAFSRCEGWSYIDAIYYCVVTLTTVGFGDFVALQSDGVLQSSPAYVVFSIFFVLVGLAVVSAAMNLLVLRFLTMNTEDERRDELRMLIATATAQQISGELEDLVVDGRRRSTASESGSSCRYVISTANGSVSGTKPTSGQHHSVVGRRTDSVWRRSRPRYHVIRPPSVITHLLPTPPSPPSALRTPTSTTTTACDVTSGCDVTFDAGKHRTLRDLASSDQRLRLKRGSI